MTQMNKFEDLNDRFASLWTEMIQQRKFRDRWCTLLKFFCKVNKPELRSLDLGSSEFAAFLFGQTFYSGPDHVSAESIQTNRSILCKSAATAPTAHLGCTRWTVELVWEFSQGCLVSKIFT
jgi:hypothetical protein